MNAHKVPFPAQVHVVACSMHSITEDCRLVDNSNFAHAHVPSPVPVPNSNFAHVSRSRGSITKRYKMPRAYATDIRWRAVWLHLKAGSQYDVRPRVALRRARIGAHRNATKRKDRLGSYPCVPLRCVLASGHEKSQIYEYFRVTQAQRNATHAPLRHIVNRPLRTVLT